MSVSTVLQCGNTVSLGGKYAFATVMGQVLSMCILISCRSVPCVPMAPGMSMFVKTMLPLTSLMSPPPRLCSPSVRIVIHPWCPGFLCEFCLLHCDDDMPGAVHEVP